MGLVCSTNFYEGFVPVNQTHIIWHQTAESHLNAAVIHSVIWSNHELFMQKISGGNKDLLPWRPNGLVENDRRDFKYTI